MNRYFNSAGTSFLVFGLAPSRNMLTQFGQAALKSGGFGKLASVPYGYGRPNAGLAPCNSVGGMSSFTLCRGSVSVTGSLAAGIGISGTSAGEGVATGDSMGLAWGAGTSDGTGSSSATIMALGVASGTSDGVGAASANIFAAVAITGLSEGSCTVTGEGYLAISLAGISEGTCTVAGESAALVNTSGSAAGSSTVSADAIGAYFATGIAEGVGTATGGDPIGLGWMDGVGPGSCTASLQPSALGFMTGTNTSGDLTVSAIATATADAVWSYERG